MPILVYFISYSGLVVLGNVLLAIYGAALITEYRTDFLSFPETFTSGFWALLLCPYVIVPAAYFATRQLLERPILLATRSLPFVSRSEFFIVFILLSGWVVWRIHIGDVLGLLRQAEDALASVEARYTIREHLGFFTLTVLQALLPFWSFIAIVIALRNKRLIWAALATVSIAATTLCLVALNTKWPVVLFYVGITIAVFAFTKRWFPSTVASIFVLVMVYLTISMFVFRLAPARSPDKLPSPNIATSEDRPNSKLERDLGSSSSATWAFGLLGSAVSRSPLFFRAAVIRLAYVYPYYYHEVAEHGIMCGGLLAQAQRGACRPAKFIYENMYPGDQFQGRGTSNISVQISAFALGGWPLAIFSLIVTGAVLAIFSCLPLDANPVSGALWIVGALAGYHFSQIPGEGVFIYEHGVIWVFLLIVVYGLATKVSRLIAATN